MMKELLDVEKKARALQGARERAERIARQFPPTPICPETQLERELRLSLVALDLARERERQKHEDGADLEAIAATAGEPTIPWDELKKCAHSWRKFDSPGAPRRECSSCGLIL